MESCFTSMMLSHPNFYFIIFMFGIILLSIKILKHNYSNKKSKNPRLPPGPKPWPIVGNLPQMLANKPKFRWIQNIINDLNTEIVCIRLGNIHVIPVTSPSIAREILMKQDAIFASRPLSWSSEHVSLGYLTKGPSPYGQQWKKMKRVITNELLCPFRIQWLYDKRADEADNLVPFVYNQCENGSALVDIRLVGKHYAGNFIWRLIFNKRYFGNGREDGGSGGEELGHVEALLILLKYFFAFSISDYVPLSREFDLDGHKKAMKEATNTIRKYHDPTIEESVDVCK